MVLSRILRKLLSPFVVLDSKLQKVNSKPNTDIFSKIENISEETSIYTNEKNVDEIHSMWDFLNFIENTQAFHLTKVIGFEEWVDMNEIRRRIHELFNITYKNERSLYPYLKTLVDTGLLETSNIGGKRKWRKKDLIIKLNAKKKEKEEIEILASQVS